MQLRRVRVRNIRSYESAEVAFPPGTTLIAGDVGAGKTSLLYAIEMALFGVAEVDAAYLVRHGAPHAEVEVEFADADHRYTVRRRFRRVHRRGRETFEPERTSFAVDGAETAYSATELRQRIIDLLGFPDNPNPQAHSDLWRWAVYVPQERMRDILSARPQDRLETVRKALGVERYRTAAENASDLATDLRRSATTRRASADRLAHHDRDHAEWTAEADRLHLERARLAELIRAREAEVAEATAARAAVEVRAREIDSVRPVLESLRREDAADARTLEEGVRARSERLAEAEERKRESERARSEAGPVDRHRSQLADAEALRDGQRARLDSMAGRLRELAEARAEGSATARSLAEATERVARAARDRAEAERRLDAVRGEGPAREPVAPTRRSLSDLDEQLAAAREHEQSTVRELTVAQRGLAELDELLAAGVCPRCHQPVRAEEFQPHRVEATEAVRRAETDHRSAVDARGLLEEERRARERYERAFERWTEVGKRRALTESSVTQAREAEASAAEARERAEAESRRAAERLRSREPIEEEERGARDALAEAERTVRERAERLDRATRADERGREAEAKFAAALAEVERRDLELAAIRRRRDERHRRIEQLTATLAEADGRSRALAEAERRRKSAEDALANERQVGVRVETRLDEATRRIQEAERGRSERSELLQEAEDLAAKAAWVGGPFRLAVLAMEQELLAHAQVAFERSFARYFASLVDDPSLLARTDTAFTPWVTIDDTWTPAEALSGGERTSLALAFRLALAQVVRSIGSLALDTVLLDEPTDGFSPEQVVRMAELLDELALPQVVLVSHESELAGIADRVVRVVKQEGRSTVEGPDGTTPPPASPPSEGEVAPPSRRRASRTAASTAKRRAA